MKLRAPLLLIAFFTLKLIAKSDSASDCLRISNPQLKQHCLQSRSRVSSPINRPTNGNGSPPKGSKGSSSSKPTTQIPPTKDMPKNPLFIELGEKIQGTGSDGKSIEIPDDAIIIPFCEKGSCPGNGPKSKVHFVYIDENCNTNGKVNDYDSLYRHLKFLTKDPTAKKDIIAVMRKVTAKQNKSGCFKYGVAQIQTSDLQSEIHPKIKSESINEVSCPPALPAGKSPVKRTDETSKPIISHVSSQEPSLPMRICKHHDELGSDIKVKFEIIPDLDGVNRCFGSVRDCGNESEVLSKRITKLAKNVDSALPFFDCRAVMDGVVAGICGPWAPFSQKQKVEKVIDLFNQEFKSHPNEAFSKMKEPDRTNFYLCVFARETANTFEPTIVNGTLCGAKELDPDSSFGLAQMVPATFEWMCNANQLPTECKPKSASESEAEWKQKIKVKWSTMATDVGLQIKASFALLNYRMNLSDPVVTGLRPWNQSPGYSAKIKQCMKKCASGGPKPSGPDSDIFHPKYYCLQEAIEN